MNKETNTFEEWKEQLIRVAATETHTDAYFIKINDESAREWYDEGWNPEYTFRETWGIENDNQ